MKGNHDGSLQILVTHNRDYVSLVALKFRIKAN